MDEKPDIVIDNLYICNVDVAEDLNILLETGITHIINVSDYPNAFPTQFSYYKLKISDSGDTIITNYVPAVNNFISTAITNGGTVLIHCTCGKSRSASLVIAYLMTIFGWSESQAFKYLKERHPPTNPNIVFRAQLMNMII